jgi:hypothetical protein
MHSDLNPTRPDSPEALSQADDGQLKTQPTKAAAVPSEVNGTSQGSPIQSHPGGRERRRSPRFVCSGSVELLAEGSRIPLRGTLTDISLHGCYTKMSTTLPVDTNVTLAVDSLGFQFRSQATVRATYPFLGMGICFSNIEPEQQAQLKKLLAVLVGQRIGKAVPPEAPVEQA